MATRGESLIGLIEPEFIKKIKLKLRGTERALAIVGLAAIAIPSCGVVTWLANSATNHSPESNMTTGSTPEAQRVVGTVAVEQRGVNTLVIEPINRSNVTVTRSFRLNVFNQLEETAINQPVNLNILPKPFTVAEAARQETAYGQAVEVYGPFEDPLSKHKFVWVVTESGQVIQLYYEHPSQRPKV